MKATPPSPSPRGKEKAVGAPSPKDANTYPSQQLRAINVFEQLGAEAVSCMSLVKQEESFVDTNLAPKLRALRAKVVGRLDNEAMVAQVLASNLLANNATGEKEDLKTRGKASHQDLERLKEQLAVSAGLCESYHGTDQFAVEHSPVSLQRAFGDVVTLGVEPPRCALREAVRGKCLGTF